MKETLTGNITSPNLIDCDNAVIFYCAFLTLPINRGIPEVKVVFLEVGYPWNAAFHYKTLNMG